MKKLSKIKLINWHLFSDQTIKIDGNTLISGENGSGKSTLLDALQYLLVGGKSGAKFNIAATDDAKRTLEGYVRGRIGAENKEFIRSGDVVSHVALEFYDEQTDEYGIIGSLLELPKMGTLKERFYMLNNLNIHDGIFMDKKTPRDYRSMKAYLKTLGYEFQPFDTQRQYRDALARYFGIDAKKYAKILPKALAFRPIDLQSFVFEFLLDDEPIDIQSLKNNVTQLKRVEGQIRLDREKLEKLDKIITLGESLNQNLEQIKINELIDQMSFIEKREAFLNHSEDLLDKVNSKYEVLKRQKDELDSKIHSNDESILELETSRQNDDVTRTLSNLKEQLNNKGNQYNEQKEIVSDLKQTLNREVSLFQDFVQLNPNTNISAFLKYYTSHEENSNTLELTSYIEGAASAASGYLNALQLEKANLEKRRNEILNDLRIAESRLQALRKNIKTYPRNVQQLMDLINEELSNYYKKEVRVRPFSDLIEIKDESWRDAVEGYLNTRRFDLIIDPLYFNDALEVYDRVKNEFQIYGVGLVNTAKIGEYTTSLPNSLASKVTTDHPHAKNYVNMTMGLVVTVENLNELRNHSRSITRSAMTYSNHTARQINPRLYDVPYIGQSSTAIQVEMDTKLVNELKSDLDKITKELEKNQFALRILNQSKLNHIVASNQVRYFESIKDTRKAYIELESKVQSLQSNPKITELEMQLEAERNKKRQLRLDYERLADQMADARSEKTRILEQIDSSRDDLNEYLKEQKQWSQKYPTLLPVAYTQFAALKERFQLNYDLISRDLAQSTIQIQSQNARAESDVINLMRQYITNYHFGAAPDLSELIEFEKEYVLIKDNNLMKYEQEAIDLRKASEVGFREEFVGKLRAGIEAAQIQISELNLALSGKRFGTDSYEIITRPSDNPEFRTYYDIIMDSDAVATHSLFTENLSKRKEIVLMELFNKIASFDPENDKFALQFLDYRYYMSYDIEVTSENGNKSYFSKVSKEKSGGETQVPFYIVIAASFQQLLSKNKRIDSGCMVLFDEAFNNMDESRIDAMMKFYNSLSIQLFIAVPPQRVSNIINYVTTSLAIVKDNDFAIVEAFKREVI
ncbi:ATP-binding protein [Acholeplasma granularum]|uniref:ATP-binding protein n=1 Tax=Acholeplasma granularum TaxID=264635 RepID=UPI00046EF477|nr:SbcC/MukB-like Walker B domain-containing protein [Acholeplasma granularum]